MRWMLVGVGCVALAACSEAPERMEDAKLQAFDVAAPAPPGVVAEPGQAKPAPITVTLPQIAYSYRYDFRLPEPAVARVQAAHIALCDRLGRTQCQLVASQSGGGESETAAASLKLRVASAIARQFGSELQSAAARAGGRPVSSSITAEDVSKAIVDTDARLRQRTLLVQRLTEVLRTHNGKVSELVEAERSVADAQEEIDQARGELADLRGRVAMSTIEINYRAIAATADVPRTGLGDAVVQSWSVFVLGLSALLNAAIYLLPWALLVGVVVVAVRQWRVRWDRQAVQVGTAPEPTAD